MVKSKLKHIIPIFLFILVLLTPLLFYTKGTVLLTINQFHTPTLNGLFLALSTVGNGCTIGICALIIILFFRLRHLYQFFLAFVFQLGIVLLFKQVFFRLSHRPFKYFGKNEGDVVLNIVDGVKMYLFGTFPSGHTTTIFFIVTFLALMINKKLATWLLLLLALFVGISRIYLVQHFFLDVYFGAIFGVMSSIIAFVIVERFKFSWYDKRVVPKYVRTRKKKKVGQLMKI